MLGHGWGARRTPTQRVLLLKGVALPEGVSPYHPIFMVKSVSKVGSIPRISAASTHIRFGIISCVCPVQVGLLWKGFPQLANHPPDKVEYLRTTMPPGGKRPGYRSAAELPALSPITRIPEIQYACTRGALYAQQQLTEQTLSADAESAEVQ